MYVRPYFIFACRWLIIAALAGFQIAAHAQVATDYAFERFMFNTAGNVSTLQPLTLNNANFAGVTSQLGSLPSVTSEGGLAASFKTTVPVGSGRSIPVTATSVASKSAVAGAVGRFIGKVAGPLAIGVALYDLAKELGYFAHKDANGNLVVDKEHNIAAQSYRVCQVEIGMGRTYDGPDCYSGVIRVIYELGQYDYYDLKCPSGPPGYLCTWKRQSTGWDYSSQVHWGASVNTPASTTYTPASSQELIDAIANKSGWPSSSALSRVVQDAVKSGETLDFTPQKITGPASSPGPSSITQNSNNTKTVTNTKNEYTYGPNTVTTNVTSSTTVIDNSTGDIIDNSTTSGSPNTEPSVDICTLYPDILACSKLGDLPETPPKLPNTEKPFEVVSKEFASNAACPAPVSVEIMGITTVQLSYQPACDFLALAKYVIVLIAAFVAAQILADSFRVS